MPIKYQGESMVLNATEKSNLRSELVGLCERFGSINLIRELANLLKGGRYPTAENLNLAQGLDKVVLASEIKGAKVLVVIG